MSVSKPSDNPFEHLDQVHGRLFALMNRQRNLAEFGKAALETDELDELLEAAARFAADGLECDRAKVLQFDRKRGDFLVRSGVGWDPGVVGRVRLGADLQSPAGYAFRTDKPVLSNNLQHERNFRAPPLLQDHGIRSAINVIIRTRTDRWGVLEVDSQRVDAFDEDDAHFLHGFANLVGLGLCRNAVRSLA
ncbi:MAG: GAF domain-containing protein [Phycisphaerales bacterium JB060]